MYFSDIKSLPSWLSDEHWLALGVVRLMMINLRFLIEIELLLRSLPDRAHEYKVVMVMQHTAIHIEIHRLDLAFGVCFHPNFAAV